MVPTRLWPNTTVEDGYALTKARLKAIDKLRRKSNFRDNDQSGATVF